MTTEYIISELEHEKRHHDLDGVEITLEDAENVMELVHSGMSVDEAVSQVLNNIYDCLAEGFEY